MSVFTVAPLSKRFGALAVDRKVVGVNVYDPTVEDIEFNNASALLDKVGAIAEVGKSNTKEITYIPSTYDSGENCPAYFTLIPVRKDDRTKKPICLVYQVDGKDLTGSRGEIYLYRLVKTDDDRQRHRTYDNKYTKYCDESIEFMSSNDRFRTIAGLKRDVIPESIALKTFNLVDKEAEAAIRRFEDEKRNIGTLKSRIGAKHASYFSAVAVAETPGRKVILMSLVNHTLQEYVGKSEYNSPKFVYKIINTIVDCLDAVKTDTKGKLVYTDVKPENIGVSTDEMNASSARINFIDFGSFTNMDYMGKDFCENTYSFLNETAIRYEHAEALSCWGVLAVAVDLMVPHGHAVTYIGADNLKHDNNPFGLNLDHITLEQMFLRVPTPSEIFYAHTSTGTGRNEKHMHSFEAYKLLLNGLKNETGEWITMYKPFLDNVGIYNEDTIADEDSFRKWQKTLTYERIKEAIAHVTSIHGATPVFNDAPKVVETEAADDVYYHGYDPNDFHEMLGDDDEDLSSEDDVPLADLRHAEGSRKRVRFPEDGSGSGDQQTTRRPRNHTRTEDDRYFVKYGSAGVKMQPHEAWDAFRHDHPNDAYRLCNLLDAGCEAATRDKTAIRAGDLSLGFAVRGILNTKECGLFHAGRYPGSPLRSTMLDFANSVYVGEDDGRKRPSIFELCKKQYSRDTAERVAAEVLVGLRDSPIDSCDNVLCTMKSIFCGIPVAANFNCSEANAEYENKLIYGCIVDVSYMEGYSANDVMSNFTHTYTAESKYPARNDPVWNKTNMNTDDDMEGRASVVDDILNSLDGGSAVMMKLNHDWGSARFMMDPPTGTEIEDFTSTEQCRFKCKLVFQSGRVLTVPATIAIMMMLAIPSGKFPAVEAYPNSIMVKRMRTNEPDTWFQLDTRYGMYEYVMENLAYDTDGDDDASTAYRKLMNALEPLVDLEDRRRTLADKIRDERNRLMTRHGRLTKKGALQNLSCKAVCDELSEFMNTTLTTACRTIFGTTMTLADWNILFDHEMILISSTVHPTICSALNTHMTSESARANASNLPDPVPNIVTDWFRASPMFYLFDGSVEAPEDDTPEGSRGGAVNAAVHGGHAHQQTIPAFNHIVFTKVCEFEETSMDT